VIIASTHDADTDVGTEPEIMSEPVMSRTEFLDLSTKVCDDLRRWVVAAAQYHNLTPERLLALNEAASIIDQQTTLLASIKPESV
jgi:hypothetical protein